MTRFGKVRTPRSASSGVQSPPWACQLISFEIDAVAAVLDLVALEPRPGKDVEWPRFTPFTVHMAVAEVCVPAVLEVLTAWVESCDVVEISVGEHAGTTWLCLAALDAELVTQLNEQPRRTSR